MALGAGAERTLILGDTDMLDRFAEDFRNCYWRLPVEEVAQFAVPSPEDCSRIWLSVAKKTRDASSTCEQRRRRMRHRKALTCQYPRKF